MKATYWQKGETLDYKNNSTNKIEAGDIVVIKGRIGIAGCDIAINEVGTLHVVGVYEMPKIESEAYEVGETLYYDAGNEVITKIETTVVAGYATQDKAANEKTAFVKIGG